MVMTGILLCAVGLIVNVIATAGIGNIFSLMISDWAGSNLLVAIVLIALASLVLGMGLPVTAAYIVLGTLSAPALYALIVDAQVVQALMVGNVADQAKALFMLAAPDQLELLGGPMSADQARALLALMPLDLMGTLREALLSAETLTFALLSAHMIIFWLSQDSNVTPPVCLTAFTAAAIAGTRPMATGLQSWKIAKGLYVMPLLFAYTPLLGGSWSEVLQIFGFAVVGLYALSGAVEGYLEAPLNRWSRVLLLASAAALLWPAGLMVHLAGGVLFVILFTLNLHSRGDVASE
jgi:TRAP-type uncharacterized transport system fused permease subunit